MPGELPDGLEIAGVPERADPRDALCGPRSLDELGPGATVGTASLRRRAQLLALRPDLRVRDLRGNVDTRLRRLAEDGLDAIVLATAGLVRLDRAGEGSPLSEDALTPAPGQGCLALEARAGEGRMRELARELTDPTAFAELAAERSLVTGIGATCHTPVGAHASAEGDRMRLRCFVGTPDGARWIRDEVEGAAGDPAGLGEIATGRLLGAGARDLLAAAEAIA